MRENGHLYAQPVDGDVTAEVRVSGRYRDQYDHAGLMLRLDETNWIKCSVELVDGVPHAAVAVTRDYSDWSIVPLPPSLPALWLRLARRGNLVEVFESRDGLAWTLLRHAHFPAGRALVGPMLNAPEGEGFTATFEELSIRPG